MKKYKYLAILFFILIHFYCFADTSNPRFKAVQNYILDGEDYQELCKDKPY